MFEKKLIVFTGVTGSGKTSTIKGIVTVRRHIIEQVVTNTTRPPRPDEIEGVHYFFRTEEGFRHELETKEIFECDDPGNGHLYGVGLNGLKRVWNNHCIPIVSVTPPGVLSIQRIFGDALTIFLGPTSFDCIAGRVKKRPDNMSPEELERRLAMDEPYYQDPYKYCRYVLKAPDNGVPFLIEESLKIIDRYLAN